MCLTTVIHADKSLSLKRLRVLACNIQQSTLQLINQPIAPIIEKKSMETEPTALSNPPRQKRSRVLLSCAPCRFSKLKCDRGTPCLQCTKKAREDLCQYAPKPEKKTAPKSMAARLKRLEGMVRGMMDEDGNVIPQPDGAVEKGDQNENGAIKGQVVRGKGEATSYVGATHCMAMLEDVSSPWRRVGRPRGQP